MPHPTKSIDFTPNSEMLLKLPELAAHIGIVAGHWTEIEDDLALLFGDGLQVEPAIAAAILGCVSNLATRLDMISTVLELGHSKEAAKRFNNELREPIKKSSKQRNHIVHAIWGLHDEYPGCLIRTTGLTDPHLRFEVYREADFAEVIMQILETRIAIVEFREALPDIPRPHKSKRSFWRPTERKTDQPANADKGRKRRSG